MSYLAILGTSCDIGTSQELPSLNLHKVATLSVEIPGTPLVFSHNLVQVGPETYIDGWKGIIPG